MGTGTGVRIQPSVRHGEPVVARTRVPVPAVLGAFAGGDPVSAAVEGCGPRVDPEPCGRRARVRRGLQRRAHDGARRGGVASLPGREEAEPRDRELFPLLDHAADWQEARLHAGTVALEPQRPTRRGWSSSTAERRRPAEMPAARARTQRKLWPSAKIHGRHAGCRRSRSSARSASEEAGMIDPSSTPHDPLDPAMEPNLTPYQRKRRERKKRFPLWMRRFSAVGFLVSVGFLGLAIWLEADLRSFFGRAESTRGTVVEVRQEGGDGGGIKWRSIAEFRDGAGRLHRVNAREAASWRQHTIGEGVQVFFDPTDPLDARLGTSGSLRVPVFVIGVVAASGLCLSSLMLWLHRPSRDHFQFQRAHPP